MDYLGLVSNGVIAVLATMYVGYMRNRPMRTQHQEAVEKIAELESRLAEKEKWLEIMRREMNVAKEYHQKVQEDLFLLRGMKKRPFLATATTVSPEKQDAEVFVTRLGPQDATDAEWQRTSPEGQMAAYKQRVEKELIEGFSIPF